MRKYTRFFAEKSIQEFPEFKELLQRYPKLEWIDDYQTFQGENMLQEKTCVIFAKKRGAWLKPFHCYENSAYRFLSLDLAEGCLFDCVYCYLQSYLNHGALVIFLNSSTLFQELDSLKEGPYWISTGLLSDSLLSEEQFSYLDEISHRIARDSILELRSKSTNLKTLENPHLSRDSIVLSWSLNPAEIANKYEFLASTLEERLVAAAKGIDLGYRIAFHLDPVFFFEGWQAEYEKLFQRLQSFPADRIAFFSIGLFRYMPDLGSIIRKRFPFHPILSEEFFPDEDGKYHYFRGIRKEMYERFVEWLKRWKEVPVFWSMEPDPSLYA